MDDPLHLVAAAILDGGKVLPVSKRAAPDVFYLPGGKPEEGESPPATLAREVEEELGVALVSSSAFAVVSDEAALVAPAIRNHVLPQRAARRLIV